MSYELVIEALRYAQEDYEYMFDHENPFTGKVDDRVIVMKRDENGKFRGDCDDFAVKFFNQAVGIGAPRGSIAFTMCLVGGNGWVDHIGVTYKDEYGDLFFIDCNMEDPEPLEAMPHKNWYRTEWGKPLDADYKKFDQKTGEFL